jgi:hypothetical protein
MPSAALQSLLTALIEIETLEKANPSPIGAAPQQPEITRVIGRASVVLLSSHYERYIHSLNEELIAAFNANGLHGCRYPDKVRLLHSKIIVEEMIETSWEHRGPQLTSFVSSDSWLWQQNVGGSLDHSRLLVWMKSPKPKEVVRYFKHWGIDDIFTAITKTTHTRSDLLLRIGELVDKRNNIAHGNPTTEATQRDVKLYLSAVTSFAKRCDRLLGRHVSRVFGVPRPW